MTHSMTGFLPVLGHKLDDGSLGEVLATFIRRRWPTDTAKQTARAWGLDPSTAANVTKGHASERTLKKALQAEGWPLLMALGEAVTGQSYEQFLRGVIDDQRAAIERAEARRNSLRSLEDSAASVLEARSW